MSPPLRISRGTHGLGVWDFFGLGDGKHRLSLNHFLVSRPTCHHLAEQGTDLLVSQTFLIQFAENTSYGDSLITENLSDATLEGFILKLSLRMLAIAVKFSFFVMDDTTFLKMFCSLYIYYCITASFFCQEFFLFFSTPKLTTFSTRSRSLFSWHLYCTTELQVCQGVFLFFWESFDLLSWSRAPRKFLGFSLPLTIIILSDLGVKVNPFSKVIFLTIAAGRKVRGALLWRPVLN